MRCIKAKKLISEYIDEELNSGQKVDLEKHLSTCQDCQKLLQDLHKIKDSTQDLPAPPSTQIPWGKIQARLEKESQPRLVPLKPHRNWLSMPSAVAAVALLLVVIGALTLGPHLWKQDLGVPELDRQEYTLAKLAEAEMHYQMAIKALGEAVAVQEEQLDPDVAEIFKINLDIVNESIAACKQALLTNPDDLDTRRYLLAAYKNKADLLDRLISLSPSSLNGESELIL